MVEDPLSEYNMDFWQKAEANKLLFEEHEVVTEDGYLLSLFRVRQPCLKTGAPVAFFQHGLVSSADTWASH